MNHSRNRPPSKPDDREHFEREWQLQERALQDERSGRAIDDDPAAAQYRRIAAALRRPPASQPPSNFAYAVAELAARRARAAARDARFEQRMLHGLAAAMVLAAIAAIALYGSAWLSAGSRLLNGNGADAAGWVGVLAVCMLLSWGGEGLLRLRKRA